MAYDPDLEPILGDLTSRIAAQEAKPDLTPPLEALAARVGAVEAAPKVPDLTAALTALTARVTALEAKLTSTTTPPAVKPIWEQLPAEPRVSIPTEIRVPPGTKEIHIPVTVTNGFIRQSFYANIAGMTNDPVAPNGINVGNYATSKTLFNVDADIYLWSPGDDPTHYIKLVATNSYPDKRSVLCSIRLRGLSDNQKGKQVRIVWDAAAVPQSAADRPAQFHRPLRRLDLSKATRANQFNPATEKWSPTGLDAAGKPCWRSQLSHGRLQDGNNETGIYADETVPGAVNPISYDAAESAIRLHTVAFQDAERIEYNSRLFRHQAAVIQGQKKPDVCGAEGVWRMVAKIPSRAYSWPAFWLVGLPASWPPEIDILEKFNGAWGELDTLYTTTGAQHYGNVGSNTRVGAHGINVETNQWPGVKMTAPIHEGYHSWACAVRYDDTDPRKCEVTWFFDDVEVGCQVLFSRHQDMKTKTPFYPIMNVAVKAPTTYTADNYNNDTKRGGLSGDMLIRDMGYYPAGFAMPAMG